MNDQRADYAAKSILEGSKEQTIRIKMDNPNDCRPTMKAFKRLGCKVRLERMGEIMIVTRP